jgi:hypothetical protein
MVEETVMEMSFSAAGGGVSPEGARFSSSDRVRRRGPADYLAILAALHWRATTGAGQYIDVAMAATLMVVNERAHVHLNDDADLGAEPTILGTTDCPFSEGPAVSILWSRRASSVPVPSRHTCWLGGAPISRTILVLRDCCGT